MNLPELQAKVRQIEIRTRRLVNDLMIGQYQSVFKGQGMDFDDIREYQPGDEVRHIDWNVTARLNQPFIKQYVEERELTIMLVIDLSASGVFGSGKQTKRDLIAEVSALLAFAAQRNNDKIGLTLFTERVEKYIAPAKGNRHVLRMVRDILDFTSDLRGGDLQHCLHNLQKTFRRRAVMVVLSDFLDPLPVSTLQQAKHRHDLIAIQVTDPREENLPAMGQITMEDAETGEVGEISLQNNQQLLAFSKHQAQIQVKLEQQFSSLGIDHIRLHTDEPYVPRLSKFFRSRLKRQLRT